MSNEQKLREALQAFENGGTGFDICPTRRLPQSEDARRVDEWWLRYFMEADLSVRVRARQALATTEPEPTGMPEMPEPDSYEFQHEETGNTMFVDRQQVEWGFEKNNPRLQKIAGAYTTSQMRAYGEQCWKAGYKHGINN